jgi:methyl-accepting chemotaxis protein
LSGFNADQMVARLSRQASMLGREAAEVRGAIEDTSQAGSRQVEAMRELTQQVHSVRKAQGQIGHETGASLQSVSAARQAVEAVGDEVAGIVESLRQVADAAGQITQIALQTRLVAFNASVEAKRAGDAGRGFGVVADAVKDLAARVETSSKDIMGTVARLDQRIGALAQEIQRQEANVLGRAQAQTGAVHRALAEVEAKVARIHEAAGRSQSVCNELAEQMATIEGEVTGTAHVLQSTLERTETFLTISEELLETVADAGLETPDTPYIRAAQAAASELSSLLDQALTRGDLRVEELFDEQYRPLQGTQPPQFVTRYCGLADQLFPQVQERMLGLSNQVVFCVAIDRNGYIACHNRKYNQPQRAGDVVWNTANCRNRRLFQDRAGLAAGRNQRPFLLQTYRRDMGGGVKVVMKEVDAPITVAGRHWGGLRLAWKF